MKESRSALLAAAAEEFAKHGRQGTRVQAIVKRAGVNERMIYHHFGSKDGLYAAVLETHLDELTRAWRPVLARAVELDPYHGMRMVLTGFVDTLTVRPLSLSLLLHEALGGWQVLPLPTADVLPEPVRSLYERGQRDGVFRSDCPFEIAYATALCALLALPILAPRFGGIFNGHLDAVPAAIRDQVVDQLLDGMTGPAAG